MSKLKQISIIALILVLFTGCFDDTDQMKLSNVTLHLEVDNLAKAKLTGLKVKLNNTSDNTVRQFPLDENATVIFENLVYGRYNLSFNHSVKDSKIKVDSVFNGVLNDLLVFEDDTVIMPIDTAIQKKDFVLSEIYTAGIDYNVLYKDAYFEVFNGTNDTLYLDGLHYAQLAGSMGSDANDEVFFAPVGEYVYAQRVCKIPGNGKDYPVAPQEYRLVSMNAINFKEAYDPYNPFGFTEDSYLDLTIADFETFPEEYMNGKGFEYNPHFHVDNPDVPDVEVLYIVDLRDWSLFIPGVGATSAIIFRPEGELDVNDVVTKNPFDETPLWYVRIPSETIIDGVDFLYNSESAKFKRLPSDVDVSFTSLTPEHSKNFTGMSVSRKKEIDANGLIKLKDTNNSAEDFETLKIPTPRY